MRVVAAAHLAAVQRQLGAFFPHDLQVLRQRADGYLQAMLAQRGLRLGQDGGQPVLWLHVVGAVHQQQRPGGDARPQAVGGERYARHQRLSVERQSRGVGVAELIVEPKREHLGAVRRRPAERRHRDLRPHPTPIHRVIQPEATQDLRQLRNVAERIRHVAHGHHTAIGLAHAKTNLEIADQ